MKNKKEDPFNNPFFRRARITMDVGMERRRQDEQWGGSDHDDKNCYVTWCDVIRKFVDKAEQVGHNYNYAYGEQEDIVADEYRERLVQVAALAFAAIEAHDRAEEKRKAEVCDEV